MCYGLLWQICLCATDYCGEFGYVRWSTVADLFMCYWPLLRVKLYSINLTSSAMWARAQDLVALQGPHAGFYYALWAITHDLVWHYGP
jgi:hypothetical protein